MSPHAASLPSSLPGKTIFAARELDGGVGALHGLDLRRRQARVRIAARDTADARRRTCTRADRCRKPSLTPSRAIARVEYRARDERELRGWAQRRPDPSAGGTETASRDDAEAAVIVRRRAGQNRVEVVGIALRRHQSLPAAGRNIRSSTDRRAARL